jgi:hypothetical protein
MAVGGNYTGLLSKAEITATTPAEMLVDYIRIYDNGHTRIGGSSLLELLGARYSGSWYSEGQSGHGFSMEFGQGAKGLSKVVGYWYIYDDLGNPIFLVGSGKLDGNRVEMTFKSPVGMQFGVFDPDSVEREDAGTAVFEFTDADNATFSYTPSEFSINTWGHTVIESLPLVKLFGIPVSDYQPTE